MVNIADEAKPVTHTPGGRGVVIGGLAGERDRVVRVEGEEGFLTCLGPEWKIKYLSKRELRTYAHRMTDG